MFLPSYAYSHIILAIGMAVFSYIFYKKKESIEETIFSYPLLQLSIYLLIAATLIELYWKTQEEWKGLYAYHPLNGMFYFLLTTSLALLALCFKKNFYCDLFAYITIPLSAIFYYMHFKPGIWGLKLVLVLIITWKSWVVLKNYWVILFPLITLFLNSLFHLLFIEVNLKLFQILAAFGSTIGYLVFFYIFTISLPKTNKHS